jgi:hypothetical protein
MASPVLEVTNRVENGRFGFTTVGGGNICGVTTSPWTLPKYFWSII